MVVRIESSPRRDWQRQVESLGFDYHSESDPYWDESAYYALTPTECDVLKRASEELHQMCLEVVDKIIRGGVYARFDVPDHFIEAIERSWRQRDLSLHGRFDFALDAKSQQWKLLEYNADTPVILLETGRVQKHWQETLYPQEVQFNTLDDALVARWKMLRAQAEFPDLVHFMALTEHRESKSNVRYMASTAERAGLSTEITSAHDFLWNAEKNQFEREDGRAIKSVFKIYPWEWMFASGAGITEPATKLFSFEPPWKYLPSNKSFLALLWKQFPGHPNLLPTYFIPEAFEGPLIKKGTSSRNSENVHLCLDPRSTQNYGPADARYIYQAVCPPTEFDGKFPVFGTWMVGNECCALGIRDDVSRISTDDNRYVPHLVK